VLRVPVHVPREHYLAQLAARDPAYRLGHRLLPVRSGQRPVLPLDGARVGEGHRLAVLAVGLARPRDDREPGQSRAVPAENDPRHAHHRPIRAVIEREAAERDQARAVDVNLIGDLGPVKDLAQPLPPGREPVVPGRERYLGGLTPADQARPVPDPGVDRRRARDRAQQVNGIRDGCGAHGQALDGHSRHEIVRVLMPTAMTMEGNSNGPHPAVGCPEPLAGCGERHTRRLAFRGEHARHRGQHAWGHPAVNPRTAALGGDEPGFPELLEMVADRGLRDPHVLDVAHAGFPALVRREPGEEPEPYRVGEGLEYAGHALCLGTRKLGRPQWRAGKVNGALGDEFRWNRHRAILARIDGSVPPNSR
jgi:hypothetical protein